MPKNNTVYSLLTLLMCSFYAIGCGYGSPGDPGGIDSDGVTGDDGDVADPGAATAEIPDAILSEPGVAEAIVAAENAGLNFGLHRTSFPPDIAGTYTSTGDQILPEIEALPVDTVTWVNQTSGNRITLVTDESDGATVTSLDEVIKGTGNEFTYYSKFHVVEADGCAADVVLISDGTVLDSGSIQMNEVFLITNIDTPDICEFTTEEVLEIVIADRLILIPVTDSQ
ncbi:hypothetical protein JYT90_00640 [bacterium AH-315-P07]|nr:hypothetical protein [bacterium AH-315-P07]